MDEPEFGSRFDDEMTLAEAPPRVDVVICTRNRADELRRCLEAATHLRHDSYRVIVVDSAPRDDSARRIAGQANVGYAVCPRPGASRARNMGLAIATAEIVAFLDDDAVPEPNWLEELVRPFSDPRVMMVTGYMAGFTPEAEAQWRAIGGTPGLHEEVRVNGSDPAWVEMVVFCPFANGATMAVRRRTLKLWGGFDPRLGPGADIVRGEENYFLFQCLRRGGAAVYTPAAVVRHPYPESREDLRRATRRAVRVNSGFLALLLVENPRYFLPIIGTVLRRAFSRRRNRREAQSVRRPISTFVTAWLVGCGFADYLRARFARRL